MSFPPKTLADWRETIDVRLRELLSLLNGAPAQLREAIEYGLLAPGKRVRPILCICAAETCGGKGDRAIVAGCAVEMIHAYSLIHDDLPAMDDDDLRRGRPTVHKKYGEALAILTGDALLTLAFEVIAREYPPVVAAECSALLARAAGGCGMVGGQVDDLTWDGKIAGDLGQASASLLQRIHDAKTGSLFRAALHMGRIASREEGPDDREEIKERALETFGRCYGLIFQITDDLLDVQGDSATTGKRVGKDRNAGKLTYPGLLGVEESRSHVRELVKTAESTLSVFGERAKPLVELVRKLVDRDR